MLGMTLRTWCARRFKAVRVALRSRAQAGMTTAEYAVGTVGACAFGLVLYKVVTSAPVSNALRSVIERALNAQF
ncbi:DUF4244 domain-containing protein [Streptomyces sp. NPDC018031]|uniref:DUF4244 domain-containing protein n=1 Tax=Streptomyces sp. NPDC018031 TaxID=3365033 RepID=UPI003797CF1E